MIIESVLQAFGSGVTICVQKVCDEQQWSDILSTWPAVVNSIFHTQNFIDYTGASHGHIDHETS